MKTKTMKTAGLFFTLALIAALIFAFSLNASAETGTTCTSCTYENGICSVCGSYEEAKKVSETHYPELNATHSGYYAIENAGQLRWFGQISGVFAMGDTPVNGVLVANITDNAKVTENGALISDTSSLRVFEPMAQEKNGFRGVFDGNGKYISGLYKSDKSSHAALFETNAGTIKNLTLKDTYFSAYGVQYSRAGAFAATNNGTIENCASFAIISGDFNSYVGMFSGFSSGATIRNSFAAYPMESNKGTQYLFNGTSSSNSSIENSYYPSNGDEFNAKTAEEFASGSVAYVLGDAWGQNIGTDAFPTLYGAKVYASYPCAKEFSNTPFTTETPHTYVNNICKDCGSSKLLVTEDNYTSFGLSEDYVGYYAISDVDQFIWLGSFITGGETGAKAVLTADMDFTGKTWEPTNKFAGILDGGAHRIKNLNVNLTSGAFALFSELLDGAIVRNLIFDSSCSIYSKESNATIAYSVGNGTVLIENCGNEASVSSKGYSGGLIRYNNLNAKVTLINCYNTGTITGNKVNGVSGLAEGQNNTFINCYNIGELVGPNPSNQYPLGQSNNISNSYSLTNQGSQISIEDVASGKLTWLLNEGKTDGTQPFYQTVGSGLPQFTGSTVYRYQINCADYVYLNATSHEESTSHKSTNLIYVKYNDSTHNKVYECCGEVVESDLEHSPEGDLTCLGTFCSVCEAYFGEKNPELHASEAVEFVNTKNDTHKMIYTCCKVEETNLPCNYLNGVCEDCDTYSIPELLDDTYHIANAGELIWWQENAMGTDAILTNDIDLQGFVWNAKRLYATLDGAGFSIYNLTSDGTRGGALFEYVYGTVKNLGIVNPIISTDKRCAIIADILVDGTISNCFTIIEGEEQSDLIEGLVRSNNGGTVENSFTTVKYSNFGPSNNVYYISEKSASNNTVSFEDAANGRLAFLLGDAWGQNIGTDKYPVLNGSKVYKNQIGGCTTSSAVYTYSNTSEEAVIEHSDANRDHVCDNRCGKDDINIDLHLDSESDSDHVCDYGCNAVLENCTPDTDDGDCTTAVKCTICDQNAIEAKASHTAGADDGDCTTAIKCTLCDKNAIEAKASHSAGADDGDCTTAIKCTLCDKDAVEAKASHTAGADDGDCTTAVKCTLCDKNAVEAKASHTAGTDDGDCTTAVKCTLCDKNAIEAKASHTAGADDGDCTTAVKCTLCDKNAIEAKAAHTGGTASCTEKAKCAVCEKEYGELLSHQDLDANGKCDACDYQLSLDTGNSGSSDNAGNTGNSGGSDNVDNNSGSSDLPDGNEGANEKDGLSGGAIAGITSGSAAVAGAGGFSLFWFGIKKKKWSDLVNVFKKKD